MTTIREVRLTSPATPTLEGAGVHLRRAFGHGQHEVFDPFLMLDDFRGDHPSQYEAGFPWHPHRGIETITYAIAGEIDHGDSMGNVGTIGAGDVQWMTAGSGIVHQEMPRGNAEGRMGGFQLWANLPAAHKMIAPRYQGITADEIPVVQADGATLRVICGTVSGVTGPAQDIVIEPEYLDVTLEPGTGWEHASVAGHTAFAYLFEGAARFGGAGTSSAGTSSAGTSGAGSDADDDEYIAAGHGTLVLLTDGDAIEVTAGADGARFLLVSGKPLDEPVAWGGPIVMNTREELRQAFRELDEGTFIKDEAVGR